MTQLTGPQDELQSMGDFVPLPQPLYRVGTRIDPAKLSAENRDYYSKQILRQCIRRLRSTVTRLKADGFMQGMRGNKFLDHNKKNLRSLLEMMATADSVEIAGAAPYGMHVVGNPGNQCYLQNGQCHSGVYFTYYLLFRKTIDDKKLVVLHTEPVISECYIKALLV